MPLIEPITELEKVKTTLLVLAEPVPSTKGMGPKDRSQRLHAELERRIKIAANAYHHAVFGKDKE